MEHPWQLRAPVPTGLVVPCAVDPTGENGPTKTQARRISWRRTSPGLYVPAGTDRGVVEQRILEEAQRLPDSGAVTGWAALRLAGANLFDGTVDGVTEVPVDLVVPRGADLTRSAGIVRHREVLPDKDVVVQHGIRCTVAARALFDAMRDAADLRAAVAVADMALAAGVVNAAELEEHLAGRARRRGVAVVRAALALADPRTLSPMETRMRLIWRLDAGLPEVLSNWPIADQDGRRLGRPDLLCEEVAVVGEYDGADHRDSRRQADDAAREQAFRNVGLESFRIVGRDIHNTALVVARMRDAVRRAQEASRPRQWLTKRDPGPL